MSNEHNIMVITEQKIGCIASVDYNSFLKPLLISGGNKYTIIL